MKPPLFAPRSQQDLQQILEYNARDKPDAALRHVERLEKACWELAENPKLGSARSDLLPGLHVWSVGRYAVLYMPSGNGIEVLRVVHGARDFAELLK